MTASRPSCHRPGLQKQEQNSRRARMVASRRLKGWRPRLLSKPTRDVAEDIPGRPRWRISPTWDSGRDRRRSGDEETHPTAPARSWPARAMAVPAEARPRDVELPATWLDRRPRMAEERHKPFRMSR